MPITLRSMQKSSALLAVLVGATACGDKGTAPAASASTEVKAPACESVPRPEQEKRCDTGDAHCCSLVLDATKTSDPKYFDVVAKACASGHEPACQVVRDSGRDPTWKLDTLEKACSRMGRWTCRIATELAIVVSADRVPKVFDNFCRQTGDSELVIGGQTLKCKKLDTNLLNAMSHEVDDCKKGDLAACKALAGVDGAAYDLYAQIAWNTRGVDPSTAATNRAQRDYLGQVVDTSGPVGNVTVTVGDAGTLDKAAVKAAVISERKDLLGRCSSWAMEHDPKTSGELELDTFVDKSGRIAYVKETATSTLKTKTDVVECIRHRLQDAQVSGPNPDVVKVTLKLKLAK